MKDTPSLFERIRRFFGRQPVPNYQPGPHQGKFVVPENPRTREAVSRDVIRRRETAFEEQMRITTVDNAYFPDPDEPPTAPTALLLPGIEIRKIKTNGEKVFIKPAEGV